MLTVDLVNARRRGSELRLVSLDDAARSRAVELAGRLIGIVREHVQRLGRILRKAENKQAILYEIIAAGTTEEQVSEQRREHVAYR